MNKSFLAHKETSAWKLFDFNALHQPLQFHILACHSKKRFCKVCTELHGCFLCETLGRKIFPGFMPEVTTEQTHPWARFSYVSLIKSLGSLLQALRLGQGRIMSFHWDLRLNPRTTGHVVPGMIEATGSSCPARCMWLSVEVIWMRTYSSCLKEWIKQATKANLRPPKGNPKGNPVNKRRSSGVWCGSRCVFCPLKCPRSEKNMLFFWTWKVSYNVSLVASHQHSVEQDKPFELL